MVNLLDLARRQFGHLTVAEVDLLQTATAGECDDCDRIRPFDPLNDPAEADAWGDDRKIRASLIRWVCVTGEASDKVLPFGLHAHSANIVGPLDLSFASVRFPLTFLQCRLGHIDLRHATIPALALSGSLIERLNSDGITVRDSVSLDVGFATSEVRLIAAQIGGSLTCIGGKLSRSSDEPTLRADRISVKGDVDLRDGFSTDGEIRMRDAQIAGNLDCTAGEFGIVNFERTRVGGVLFWRGVGKSESLDLSDVSTGVLTDDEDSWPTSGKLRLEGLVYQRIIAGPLSVEKRLDWLQRQEEFAAQPYRQFAKTLQEIGDEEGSKEVLYELEKERRREERRRLVHAPFRWLCSSVEDEVSKSTVGYGIYPMRAVGYSALLGLLGWLLFRRAQRIGAMAPTDKDAYDEFKKGRLPSHYPPFNPLIYSLENCIPLVKLGQDERWQPDPHPTWISTKPGKARTRAQKLRDAVFAPASLRWFRWIVIALGWLLTTFFVAGVTGVIRTN